MRNTLVEKDAASEAQRVCEVPWWKDATGETQHVSKQPWLREGADIEAQHV